MQKVAYGFLGLKPKEFWELQPKDIILMEQGFLMKREYNESLHRETLYLLREIGYTVYCSIPKKGRNDSRQKYLKFWWEKETTITEEYIKQNSNKKEPLIQNGKVRGYLDTKGNLWCSKKTNVIARMENGELKYFN